MQVCALLATEMKLDSVATSKLFRDAVNYCSQYKAKPPYVKKKSEESAGTTRKKRGAKKPDPISTVWAEKEGMQVLQLLGYQMMANVSDVSTPGDGIELGPMWSRVEANVEHWTQGVHDFGSILLGYQTSTVSTETEVLLIVIYSNLFPVCTL